VARYADIWNIIPRSVEEFAHKSATLDGYCASIGRDPATILRSVQVATYDKSLDHLSNEVGKYIAAGVRQIILEMSPRSSPDAIQTIARQVVVPFLTPSASQGSREATQHQA